MDNRLVERTDAESERVRRAFRRSAEAGRLRLISWLRDPKAKHFIRAFAPQVRSLVPLDYAPCSAAITDLAMAVGHWPGTGAAWQFPAGAIPFPPDYSSPSWSVYVLQDDPYVVSGPWSLLGIEHPERSDLIAFLEELHGQVLLVATAIEIEGVPIHADSPSDLMALTQLLLREDLNLEASAEALSDAIDAAPCYAVDGDGLGIAWRRDGTPGADHPDSKAMLRVWDYVRSLRPDDRSSKLRAGGAEGGHRAALTKAEPVRIRQQALVTLFKERPDLHRRLSISVSRLAKDVHQDWGVADTDGGRLVALLPVGTKRPSVRTLENDLASLKRFGA